MKKEVKFQNAQQLVIKSPPNTARVKSLLSLFPNAKFVHIFRSPYSVFCSTMKLMRLSLPLTTLQALPSEAMLEDIIIERYKIIYRAYLRDRALIPAENLVEVRFEDFIKDPMAGMENIYTKLGINSFSDAKESFKEYFEEQKSHRVDSYEMSKTVKEKLERELNFAFKAFGYDTKE